MSKVNLIIFMQLFIVFYSVHAQDILTLRTGEELKVKVLDMERTGIKFKKFDDLKGPDYAIPKSDIFMVVYEDGTRNVFNDTPLVAKPMESTESQIKRLIEQGVNDAHEIEAAHNKRIQMTQRKMTKGITFTAMGVPMLGTGIGLIGAGINYLTNYGVNYVSSSGQPYTINQYADRGAIFVIAGAIATVIGIPFSIVGSVNLTRAIRYKKRYNTTATSMSFEPMLRPDVNASTMVAGAGMKIRF